MCADISSISGIGIGFRRAGSSWLHRLLSAQPGIRKPANGLNYFSDEYHRGPEWYMAQIGSPDEMVKAIEMSVSYGYPENVEVVSNRIKNSLGTVPLFAIVRNPIDRAYSDYLRSTRMGEISDITFSDALVKYPEFTQRGFYAALLKPFVDTVGAQLVYVMVYENLVLDPEKELTRLFEYIGACFDPNSLPENDKKLNWGKPRAKILYSVIYNIKGTVDRVAKTLGMYDTWSDLKLSVIKPYQILISSLSKKESMDKSVRDRLVKLYAADVTQLESMCNIELPWVEFRK